MRNYTCVLLPFYLLSDLLPSPPSQTKCVVDTGDKFAAGVNDTGGKFSTGVNDAGGKLKFIYMLTLLLKVVQKKS